jgi:hypothetical protein
LDWNGDNVRHGRLSGKTMDIDRQCDDLVPPSAIDRDAEKGRNTRLDWCCIGSIADAARYP